jgi:effector-binding domain-containing protein
MPIREVGELVAVIDPDARAVLIGQHLERLETQLNQTQAAVISLRRLLEPSPAPLVVQHSRTEAITVVADRDVVDLSDVLSWYDSAMDELEAVISAAGVTRTGPAGGLYDNELFTDERRSVVVYAPVADAPSAGAVRPWVIPATELATTMHQGAHDDIDVTYGAPGTYVRQQALEGAGPVRDIYRVDPVARRTLLRSARLAHLPNRGRKA